jgi:hypothetical protein
VQSGLLHELPLRKWPVILRPRSGTVTERYGESRLNAIGKPLTRIVPFMRLREIALSRGERVNRAAADQ